MKLLLTKNGKLVPANHISLHPRRKRSLHVIRIPKPDPFVLVPLTLWIFGLAVLFFLYRYYSAPLLNPMGSTVPIVYAQEAPTKTPQQIIRQFAYLYGVPEKLALCIAKNESGFRADAVGDSGLAVGILQFHRGTFLMFQKKMGLKQSDDRTDVVESARVAMWAIANGYGKHWSTYRRCL